MPELKKYDVTYYLSSTLSKAKSPDSKIQHNVITVEAESETEALTKAATPKRVVISAKLRGPGRKKAQELLTQAEIYALLLQQQDAEEPSGTQTEPVAAEQETQTDEVGDPVTNELADADGAGCDCAYCTSEAAQAMRDTIAEGLQDFVGKPTEEVQGSIKDALFSLFTDQDQTREEAQESEGELQQEPITKEQVEEYLNKIDRTIDTLTRSLEYAEIRLDEAYTQELDVLDAKADTYDKLSAVTNTQTNVAVALGALREDHVVLPKGITRVLTPLTQEQTDLFDAYMSELYQLDAASDNRLFIEKRVNRLQEKLDGLTVLRQEIVKLLPVEEPAAKLSFTSLTFSVAWNFLLLLLVAVCVFGMLHTVTDIPGVERLAYVFIIAGVAARFAFQYLSKKGVE